LATLSSRRSISVFSRPAISASASRYAGSSRIDVRRPKIVTLRGRSDSVDNYTLGNISEV
jgi:hypothetical protein